MLAMDGGAGGGMKMKWTCCISALPTEGAIRRDHGDDDEKGAAAADTTAVNPARVLI